MKSTPFSKPVMAFAGIGCLALATSAQADFISPVDATATSNWTTRVASNTVNGKGITSGSGVDGIHNNNTNDMWHPDGNSIGHSITFDLGETYTTLEKIYIWNYNENHAVNNNNARGVKDFTVEVSADGVNWGPPASGANQTAAAITPAATIPLSNTLDFTATNTRYVRFTIVSSQTGQTNYVGFSEVAFEGSLGPDVTPPALASTTPADDSTGIYPGTTLSATFDENIALTPGGVITLTDLTDGTDVRTITLPDTRVSATDMTVTIVPGTALEFGTEYEVTIDGSAIQDLAAAPNSFGGTTSGAWTLTTAPTDGTAPVLALVDPFSPADEATAVLLNTPLVVTFDEDILANPGASSALFSEDFEAGSGTDGGFAPVGTPNDWSRGTPISDNNDGLIITTGNGGSANCWATNLGTGGTPSGGIDPAADSILRGPGDGVTASTGIDLSGVATAQLQFAAAIDAHNGDAVSVLVKEVGTGTTLVTVPVTALTPPVTADWATYGPYDISDAAGSEVYLEFRFDGTSDLFIGLYIDDIEITGVNAANAITLKDLTNMTDTFIPISDNSQVSVSGATLTVTPSDTLAPMANYAIQIGSTAIRNYNDLDFAGISNTTTWNFATTGPMLLTWDPGGGGTSDGGGTWLDAGKWWNGSANVDWGNSTPDNAIIGNGGGANNQTISLAGDVNAGTVLLDNYTGTYRLDGGTLNQSGGITIGANAGGLLTRGGATITGAGGITMNSPGLANIRESTLTHAGPLTINNGVVLIFDNLSSANVTLNGGMLTDYYRRNTQFPSGLGTGSDQIQIFGDSGFGGGNGNSSWTIGGNGSTLQWGSTHFNPTSLRLRAPLGDNNGTNIYGQATLNNKLDLNGGARTIWVNGGSELAGYDTYAEYVAWGRINNGIEDTTTGGSLVKTGGGTLIFGGVANTYDGGTTVNEGWIRYDRADQMPDTGNHAFNDGSGLWVAVGGSPRFSADPSGAGSLGGLLTGTGPGTSTTSFSGIVDLGLMPNGSPDYAGPIGSHIRDLTVVNGSMTLSGTNTYTGTTSVGLRNQNAVTVTLGSGTALPSGTPVTIDTRSTSVLDLNGHNATVGHVLLGSNNGGQGGTVDDTAGGGVLTITDGITVDSHNDGGGRILCDTLDLNGSTQTFRHLGNNRANSDLIIGAAIQNGGLITNATNGQTEIYLNGANTYTGGTTHQAGRLVVNGSLADATMDVQGGNVQGSGTLTFNISGATIDQVVTSGGSIDISGMTANVLGTPTAAEYILVDATGGGSYSGNFAGSSLPAGYSLDYDTPNQVKIVGTPGGAPYDTWAGTFPTLTDTNSALDFDKGGLQTGIEWVVGGDPTDPADDAGLAPGIDTNSSPGNALFVFRRTDEAAGDANTTIKVEYGSTLQGWTEAVDGTAGVDINIDDEFYGTGIDKVTVTLPAALAVDGALYARLNVVVTAP